MYTNFQYGDIKIIDTINNVFVGYEKWEPKITNQKIKNSYDVFTIDSTSKNINILHKGLTYFYSHIRYRYNKNDIISKDGCKVGKDESGYQGLMLKNGEIITPCLLNHIGLDHRIDNISFKYFKYGTPNNGKKDFI